MINQNFARYKPIVGPDPLNIRARRVALGLRVFELARIAAVCNGRLSKAERGMPVPEAMTTRLAVALSLLEQGASDDKARAAAIDAAPLGAGKSGDHTPLYEPDKPIREHAPPPFRGEFYRHNIAPADGGYYRHNRPATHVERQASS